MCGNGARTNTKRQRPIEFSAAVRGTFILTIAVQPTARSTLHQRAIAIMGACVFAIGRIRPPRKEFPPLVVEAMPSTRHRFNDERGKFLFVSLPRVARRASQ